MQQGDLRDGQSELSLAAGFYLETEIWAEEKLVDGLLCYAPYTDGVKAVGQLQEKVNIPTYLWREFTGYKGKVQERPLEAFKAEAQALRDGDIDGYCLLIMQITDNPLFQPDWTAVLSK